VKSLRVAAALLAALAISCARKNVYVGHGTVESVDRDERQAVISHDAIPGLMDAMTMSFDVPDPAVLERLAPGRQIEFDLEVADGSFRIVAARAEGSTAGAARGPAVSSLAREAEVAPSFTLTDQDGKSVSLASLRGRSLLIDFVYTHCMGPCPILTSKHVELQRSLPPLVRERVHFVSITLDPANDTPEALTRYAKERGADLSGWSFLTGPEVEVAEVVRSYGVGTLRAPDGSIDHVVATFLVDGQGRIAKRWLGLEHKVEELRAALVASAEEPAAGPTTP
jgi:protein SCO1/2